MRIERNALVLVLFLPVFFLNPIFHPGLFQGHETAEKTIQRLVEFDELIRSGCRPPRWAADFNNGLGSPFFIFYPPFFIYVSESFLLSGFSPALAVKSAIVLCSILMAVGMFLLSRRYLDPFLSLTASAAYVYFPYHIMQLYIRGAYAEFSAGCILPWVFWSAGHMKARPGAVSGTFFGVSLAILMISHNVVVLFSVPVIFMFLLLDLKNKPSHLLSHVAFFLMGLALSAYFWVPAIFEKGLVHIDRMKTGYFSVEVHFAYLSQILTDTWGFGPSIAGPDDRLPFQIGIPWIILFCAGIAAVRTKQQLYRNEWIFWALITVIFLCINLNLSAGAWKIFPIFQFSQFPWRTFTVMAIPVSLLAAKSIEWLTGSLDAERDQLKKYVGLIAALCFSGYSIRYIQAPAYSHFEPSQITTRTIREGLFSTTASGEYTPRWTQDEHAVANNDPIVDITSGNAIIGNILETGSQIEFDIEVMGSSRIILRRLYYPGWILFSKSGAVIDIHPAADGRIQADVPAGTHHLRLEFRDTRLRRWADLTTLISAGFLLIVFLTGCRKDRRTAR